MNTSLDELWEELKHRYPQLRYWDQTVDQSHMHHTLVTILLFGTLGMVMAFAFHGWDAEMLITKGLASGLIGGVCGYLVRECGSRLRGNELSEKQLWDGVLDVVVPATFTLPWALSALLTDVPAWTGVLLYVGGAFVALMYSFLRPSYLHYDKSKDQR